MSIDVILSKIERVRKSGRNKWRCPCPIHGGKDFNMIVSERSDGSVGAHCFVCNGNGVELCHALGLSSTELFPDDGYKPPVITKEMELNEKMDRMVLMMADATPPVTLADKRRIKLAQSRLEGLEAKRNQIKETKSVAF